jgi:hypothetical protein
VDAVAVGGKGGDAGHMASAVSVGIAVVAVAEVAGLSLSISGPFADALDAPVAVAAAAPRVKGQAGGVAVVVAVAGLSLSLPLANVVHAVAVGGKRRRDGGVAHSGGQVVGGVGIAVVAVVAGIGFWLSLALAQVVDAVAVGAVGAGHVNVAGGVRVIAVVAVTGISRDGAHREKKSLKRNKTNFVMNAQRKRREIHFKKTYNLFNKRNKTN